MCITGSFAQAEEIARNAPGSARVIKYNASGEPEAVASPMPGAFADLPQCHAVASDFEVQRFPGFFFWGGGVLLAS